MSYRQFKGQPKTSKACGICTNKKHHGLLSLRNMKNHKCESKQCKWFVKIPDHPYWEQKEKKNADKKLKKRIRQNEETIKRGTAEEIASLIANLLVKGGLE